MSRIQESPIAARLYVAGFLLLAFLLTLVPLVPMLGGSRVAWVFLLAVEIALLAYNIVAGPRWPVPILAVLVALLLAPSTRTFVWRRPA